MVAAFFEPKLGRWREIRFTKGLGGFADPGKSSRDLGMANTLDAMLSAEDRAILDFERGWWTEPGPKDWAIEFGLGVTAAVYYERLLALVDRPEALGYDPLTIKRVRRMIETETGGGLIN